MIDKLKAYGASVMCLVLGVALIACSIRIVILHNRTSALAVQVSKLTAEAATERSLREQAAREFAVKVAQLMRDHAASQQAREDIYAKEKQALTDQRDAERVAAVRLRDKLVAATARRSGGGKTDAASCERDAGRLEDLGHLAGEGSDLVTEARAILRERDAKVKRLQDQITLDRQSCSAL